MRTKRREQRAQFFMIKRPIITQLDLQWNHLGTYQFVPLSISSVINK